MHPLQAELLQVRAWTEAELAWLARGLPLREIRDESGVYLARYTIAERPGGGFVYLHHFHNSDRTHELHSHPWGGHSLILLGGYSEERRLGRTHAIRRQAFGPGAENEIEPDTFHRIDLLDPAGSWSLFVTTPYQRGSWGFWNRHTGRFRAAESRLRERGIR